MLHLFTRESTTVEADVIELAPIVSCRLAPLLCRADEYR